MPKVGETLALSVQLFDGDATKFVRAVLTDASGASLPASPVTLTHVSGGRYEDSGVVMPSGTAFVACTYETFDDALFVTVSADHSSAIDTFPLEVPFATIQECLDQIKDALENLDLLVGGIGQVGDVLALVTEDETIIALVDEEGVIATVFEEDTQQTVVASDDAIGLNLSDDNQIISSVECE